MLPRWSDGPFLSMKVEVLILQGKGCVMGRKSYLPDTTKVLQSAVSAVERVRAGLQQRKWGRVHIESLPCNLGRVIDLSAGGVRIATCKRLPETVQIILGDRQSHLVVDATVAWQKRVGWKSFEAGVAFGELSAEQRQCLIKLMHSSTLVRRDAA